MLNQSIFLSELANILRQMRKSKHFTFEKLADISNVDYSTLNLIEHSKQNPRLYTIYKILYALNVDLLNILQEDVNQRQDKKREILAKFEMLDVQTLEALDIIVTKLNVRLK